MSFEDVGFQDFDILALVRDRLEIGADRIVDVRGLRCPQPARQLRKALSDRPTGDRFAIVADDPLARIDIPEAASQFGGFVVAQCVTGDTSAFLIERHA